MGIRPGADGRTAWTVVLSICYGVAWAKRQSKTVAAINFSGPVFRGDLNARSRADSERCASAGRQISATELTALGNLFSTQQQRLQIILVNIQQFTVL